MNISSKRAESGNLAVLITAAGLSSRMGQWKAAMTIDGVPNIVRILRTAFQAGVKKAWIVTGYRAEELENLVQEAFPQDDFRRIRFVCNERYESTQMFDSLCLGLKAIRETPDAEKPEGIFFSPVDVPLVSAFTCQKETEGFLENDADFFVPEAFGKPGHPLLIRFSAVPRILAHNGERGLRGVLEADPAAVYKVPVPDIGCTMDADTPEEFRLLLQEAGQLRIPDETRCLALLHFFGAPESLIAHGRTVAELAGEIARSTGKREEEARLAVAAGWLHDLAKGQPQHAGTGAAWLDALGYGTVAKAVGTHMDLPEEEEKQFGIPAILYLADKLVKGNQRTSLEERFAPGRERFLDNPEAMKGLERRYRAARRLLQEAEMRGFFYEREGRLICAGNSMEDKYEDSGLL